MYIMWVFEVAKAIDVFHLLVAQIDTRNPIDGFDMVLNGLDEFGPIVANTLWLLKLPSICLRVLNETNFN
jgi:hypothetical protein